MQGTEQIIWLAIHRLVKYQYLPIDLQYFEKPAYPLSLRHPLCIIYRFQSKYALVCTFLGSYKSSSFCYNFLASVTYSRWDIYTVKSNPLSGL